MGGLARLWESKTALRPITEKINAKRWSPAWTSFSLFLGTFRPVL